jgi:signal transduction histidine kinase
MRPGAAQRLRMKSAELSHRLGVRHRASADGIRASAPAARRVANCVAAASIVLLTGTVALAYADRHLLPAGLSGWDFTDVFGDLVGLAVPVVGLVVVSRRPGNRVGWLFLAAGLALGLWAFSAPYAHRALVAAPGSMPAGQAFAWLSSWAYAVPVALLGFVFLLFPDGKLRSPRWAPAAWFTGVAFMLGTVALLVNATRVWSNPDPFNSALAENPFDVTAVILIVAALVVSLAAVVVRYALSAGEERLQLKWFAAAAAFLVATSIPTLTSSSVVANALNALASLFLFVAIGVAVLKYRLYEIDIVISKAVLYGSLAIFITGVYAGLVAGVGTLVGNRRSPLLAAVAAAVVAVAFQPVRHRAGRLANRVVYGRRATPYQVLSDFAQRIGGTYAAGEVLPQMAHIVAAGTGAEWVVVWLRVGDGLRPEATFGGGPNAAPLPLIPVQGQVMPSLPDADLSVPVMHQGELLGAISLRMPKGEPLRPAGQQLVTDLASQAGLVLANAGLIEDLRASRQRLVAAQDEERRRLERNIHDGAQQDLVALAIKLRLGTTVEDLAQVREIFEDLQADAVSAIENLRDLARGIYPPLLADLGLVAALNAQASKSAVPVTVEADTIGRLPQDTEAAVYFSCLEALQNTAKHAKATQARICLQVQNGTLRFTVSDDGTGYDACDTSMGSGQRNMADRVAALGGRLEVRSALGQGTIITGQLPAAPSS